MEESEDLEFVKGLSNLVHSDICLNFLKRTKLLSPLKNLMDDFANKNATNFNFFSDFFKNSITTRYQQINVCKCVSCGGNLCGEFILFLRINIAKGIVFFMC